MSTLPPPIPSRESTDGGTPAKPPPKINRGKKRTKKVAGRKTIKPSSVSTAGRKSSGTVTRPTAATPAQGRKVLPTRSLRKLRPEPARSTEKVRAPPKRPPKKPKRIETPPAHAPSSVPHKTTSKPPKRPTKPKSTGGVQPPTAKERKSTPSSVAPSRRRGSVALGPSATKKKFIVQARRGSGTTATATGRGGGKAKPKTSTRKDKLPAPPVALSESNPVGGPATPTVAAAAAAAADAAAATTVGSYRQQEESRLLAELKLLASAELVRLSDVGTAHALECHQHSEDLQCSKLCCSNLVQMNKLTAKLCSLRWGQPAQHAIASSSTSGTVSSSAHPAAATTTVAQDSPTKSEPDLVGRPDELRLKQSSPLNETMSLADELMASESGTIQTAKGGENNKSFDCEWDGIQRVVPASCLDDSVSDDNDGGNEALAHFDNDCAGLELDQDQDAPEEDWVAQHDHTAKGEDQISFLKGDTIIDVGLVGAGGFWMQGTLLTGESGLFPANYVEKMQQNPLWLAVQAGDLDRVALLLAANANPDVHYEGTTPLYTACERGNLQVVNALIEGGADLNMTTSDTNGFTPLYVSAEEGHFEVVALLLAANANPDVASSDSYGFTPLYIACERGNVQVVNALIEGGANLNMGTQDDFQFTPLYTACERGNLQVVSLLIEGGADLNIGAADDGTTPTCIASEGKRALHSIHRPARVRTLIYLCSRAG